MVTAPVFIVACPRSGTTKLASLLNKHSAVASATETHFFNHVSRLSCFSANGDLSLEPANLSQFFAEPRVQDYLQVSNMGQDELATAFLNATGESKTISKREVFNIMTSEFLKAKSKTIFCEKTPQHLQNVNEIHLLYPDARFIHLVRDGRDVVSSLIKMPWRPPGLINNARFWQRYIKLGEAAARALPADRFLTVRYEDLLMEPETTLKTICAFVGIEFEDTMIASGSTEPIFANWEAEWKHKASQAIDTSRIGAWREELGLDAAAILNGFLTTTIKKLGYTVSGERVHQLSIKHRLIIAAEYTILALTKILRLISLQDKLSLPKLFVIPLLLLNLLSPVLAKPQPRELEREPYLQMTSPTSTLIRYRSKKPRVTSISFNELNNSPEFKSVEDDLLKTEHEILLTGLKPDTRYIYSLNAYKKSKKVELGRGSYYFKTAPVPGESTRVWVLGDSGTKASSRFNKYHNAQVKVRDAFVKFNNQADLDMLLMLGDNTYWYGKDDEYTKGLFKPYALQLSAAPVFPVLGNHDAGYQKDLHGYSSHSYPLARGPYYDAFTLPSRGELGGLPSGSEAYYSFDYGAAHFIMLDSYDSHEQKLSPDESLADVVEPRLTPNNRMITWLKADLEAFTKAHPDSSTRPWLIAVFHHPVHTLQIKNSEAELNNFWKRWMQSYAIPLLEEYNTDIVFSGHIHRYERTKPLPLNKAHGTTYIVLGSSGSSFGNPQSELSEEFLVSSSAMGSGLMDISSKKLEFKFVDINATVVDSFTLEK